jgi:multidrug efflux pump subunit AcrB
MGIIALSGIVVNDSLILIVAINRAREAGMPPTDAVIEGAVSRFRPVLLTSLTTFFGLMPMILEPSLQARFLIPMAISLGFGVLFATFITLVFVPVAYLILDDIRQAVLGRSAPPQSNPASGQRPLPFDTDSSPGTPAD